MVVMRRKLGQHFLRSQSALRAVVNSLDVSPDTLVVEVGPGKGALTELIIEKYTSVIAVEKDAALVSVLEERFADALHTGDLTLILGDVRDGDWLDTVGDREYVVIANIPYYLTGSLLRDLLSGAHPPEALSLVVQKEVAERISRRGGDKESLLSLSVQLFGVAEYIKAVPRRSFSPQPAVDSAIITITDVKQPPRHIQDAFFSTIKTAFHEKRKSFLKKFKGDQRLSEIFIRHGITSNDRAEDVPFSVWLAVVREYTGSVENAVLVS